MAKTGLRNLCFLRKARGLSQAKLAAAIGHSRSYVSQIETGERDPSQRVMEAVAAALGCPIGDLFLEPSGTPLKVKTPRARRLRQPPNRPVGPAVPFDRLTSEYQQLGQQRRRIVAELATLDARLDTLLGLI